MNLAVYINDLLYRYDCVIVPDFGGFVTNKVGAKIDEKTHLFYPPTKQITFNSYLKHNDGLLANHIAGCEAISFQEANEKINEVVTQWNASLPTSEIVLQGVGVLFLNRDGQLGFEPEKDVNFLVDSFGLLPVEVSQVEQQTNKDVVLQVVNDGEQIATADINQSSNKTIPLFVRYAAAAAIALTLGLSVFQNYSNKETVLEQPVQKASFVMDTPSVIEEKIPVKDETEDFATDENFDVVQEEEVKDTHTVLSKNFHIVAGAFGVKSNAEKKVKQLINKGFKASIIGKNTRGLIQVAFASFSSEVEAEKALQKIKTTQSSDAWLLVKK